MILYFFALIGLCRSVLEPEGNKTYLGISLTNTLEPLGKWPWKPSQSLSSVNFHSNLSWSAFHVVQEIPEHTLAPLEYFDQSQTNAIIYWTILPTLGYKAITDTDIEELVNRCEDLNRRGRSVFLRYAPEMNSPWHSWGMKPVEFTESWLRLYSMLRERPNANQTALVWAPFEGNAYPFGNFTTIIGDEFTAMDTNQNGIIDSNDDPYEPYFPGVDYLDWVGLSVYWRPQREPPFQNTDPPGDYVRNIITGFNGDSPNFYKLYSVDLNKPMMLADTGAFYYRKVDHKAVPVDGVSEQELKQSWWKQFLKDPIFSSNYSNIRFICLTDQWLEGIGVEQNYLLDTRIFSNPVVLKAFVNDIQSVSKNFQWSKPANLSTYDPPPSYQPSVPPSDDGGIGSVLLAILIPFPALSVFLWIAFVCWKQFYYNRSQSNEKGGFDEECVDDTSTFCRASIVSSQATTSEDAFGELYLEREEDLDDAFGTGTAAQSESTTRN